MPTATPQEKSPVDSRGPFLPYGGASESLSARRASQVSGAEGGIGGGVDPSPHSLGTKSHNCHSDWEAVARALWIARTDAAWAPLAEARALALEARGEELVAAGGDARWHARRAASLRRPIPDKLRECPAEHQEGNFILVACACGSARVPMHCGQAICPSCVAWKCGKLKRRIKAALKRHGPAEAARHRYPILMTLTVRHSGDPATDHSALQAGWAKLRKWVHRRLARFTFVMVWESTPGRDELGHVHSHAIVFWPTGQAYGSLDWGEVRAEWCRAVGDESARPDLEPVKGTIAQAAHYLSKYLTKALEPAEFTPELAARIIDSAYNRRQTHASEGFWDPVVCEKCGEKVCLAADILLSVWCAAAFLASGTTGDNPSSPVPDD